MNVDIYPTTVWLSHLLNDVAAFIRCSCQANILVQLDGHKVHIELGDHWQTDPLSSGKIHFLFVYRLHNVLDGKFRIKLTADSAIVESSLMQTFQSGGSPHMYCVSFLRPSSSHQITFITSKNAVKHIYNNQNWVANANYKILLLCQLHLWAIKFVCENSRYTISPSIRNQANNHWSLLLQCLLNSCIHRLFNSPIPLSRYTSNWSLTPRHT